MDLQFSISNDIVSTKINDKRDDFDFEIVNFPFLMVLFLALHPMEFIFLISIVLLEHLAMLLTSTLAINYKLRCILNKTIGTINFAKVFFSKFYRQYYDLISKFNVRRKSLLRQILSEPDFYGGLVYKLKKIVGPNNFTAQVIKKLSHY